MRVESQGENNLFADVKYLRLSFLLLNSRRRPGCTNDGTLLCAERKKSKIIEKILRIDFMLVD